MKKFFILILIVTLLFSACEKTIEDNTKSSLNNNDDIIGVWINYYEINSLVSECETLQELNNKIILIFNEFTKFNINTIFLHSRAFDDCFYKSKTYQPSDYCINDNNELKFDVLQSFIDCSSNFNIEIHAWINPYRIRNDNNAGLINKKSLAGEWYAQNPDDQRLIITDNSIFYNPASLDVQKYVLCGIKEILDNYNVSGIHIDDYFYPTTNEDIDVFFYNQYVKENGMLKLSDFRRQNINALITSIYTLVKSYNQNLIFSISPSANIEENYNSHYADVKLWASTTGYVDYIIPQIYFGFEHESMPFKKVLNEWIGLKTANVKIAIGLALYKSGKTDEFAKSGKNEWVENTDIINRQISLLEENEMISGYSFYSSKYLLNDYNDIL